MCKKILSQHLYSQVVQKRNASEKSNQKMLELQNSELQYVTVYPQKRIKKDKTATRFKKEMILVKLLFKHCQSAQQIMQSQGPEHTNTRCHM